MSTEIVFKYSKVGETLKEISRKINERVQTYIWVPIKCLGCNIPICELSQKDAENILIDYVERRCRGDFSFAKSSITMWKAHTITMCIPGHEKLMKALYDGSYMTPSTENIVVTQIYLEIISLNPFLDWNNLCWPKDPEVERKKEISKQILTSVVLLQDMWQKECAVGGATVGNSFFDLVKSLKDYAKTS